MKFSSPFSQFFLFLGAILSIGLNTFWLHSAVFGGIVTLIYFLLLAWNIGNFLFPSFSKVPKIAFGFLVTLCQVILLSTFIYYLYKITPLISFSVLLSPTLTLLILWWRKKGKFPTEEKIKTPSTSKKTNLVLSTIIILLNVLLLFILYKNRTFELSPSPWQNVGPIFFVLYALNTGLLLWSYRAYSSIHYFTTSLHFFVTWGVASLMYPLGYGFDAFIHRATEDWIVQNGFIAPKTPYYIGQYSLIAVLSHITSLSVKVLDVYIVPILSSLILPAIIPFTLEKALNLNKQKAFSLVLTLLFIPFFSLHLTTPHNFVLLLTFVTVFALLLTLIDIFPIYLLFIFAITAISIHALIGVPLFVVIFFLWIAKSIKKFRFNQIPLFLLLISLALLLPAMFTLNSIRVGAPLPEIANPLSKLPQFISLFEKPYWYAKTSAWYLEVVYLWERLIVPVYLFISLLGIAKLNDKFPKAPMWIFPVSFLGFIASAFLLVSWLVFPDVVSYEQKDYPMRLLKTSLIFLLPAAMYGIHFIWEKVQANKFLQSKNKIVTPLVIVSIAFALTLSFYLSYPQRNPKVRFPGFNVTASDMKTVEWIHNRHTDYNYIVLSNQLVSAAALSKYSFAKYFQTPQGEMFYYAIPTGGKLYQYYGKMIYEGQKREYMDAAMDMMGVNTAYFVVNRYWANSDKIVEGALDTADEYYPVDDGKVWIFVYYKK